MKRHLLFAILISFIFCIDLFAQSIGYYRFPAIRGETIVFTSEGDLWKVGVAGGTALRLTTHHGTESHPAISPDGKQVAFSAEYEGPTEVYTMPIDGGLPTRWTYEGETATVVGWTPTGQILYSTEHFSTLPNTQLGVIDLEKRIGTVVALSQASDGSFEPGGKALFFTRLPFQGSRTKRYLGGTAQNIWKFADGREEAEPLTADYPGTSKTPMWWNGRVYFASDRDGTMNIWSMDESGGDLRQHTSHQGWDIQSPAVDNGKIVYQLGADLYLLDIAGGTTTKVPITIASDFDQTRENWVEKPVSYLSDVHISPDGSQIVLTARGKVFVAPAEKGRFVEVTRKQGVRYRSARFLPDKKSLLLLSDASGEQEFWKYPANGLEEGQQLTRDAKVLRFGGVAAPDGKRFAFTDKNAELWIGEFDSQQPIRIDVSNTGGFSDLSWSPDSKWLAYVAGADNFNSQIVLYSTESQQKTKLTSDRVDSYSPGWSTDGKWLYFLSDRSFQNLVGSPWGPRQPEPFYDKTTKIYAVSLLKDQQFPFKHKDELQVTEKPEEQKDRVKKDEKKDAPETVSVKIDLDGIQTRVMEVPVKAG
ncbi:MAG TPA: protease, partial [bacterium]